MQMQRQRQRRSGVRATTGSTVRVEKRESEQKLIPQSWPGEAVQQHGVISKSDEAGHFVDDEVHFTAWGS